MNNNCFFVMKNEKVERCEDNLHGERAGDRGKAEGGDRCKDNSGLDKGVAEKGIQGNLGFKITLFFSLPTLLILISWIMIINRLLDTLFSKHKKPFLEVEA